jgi:hypothetical protein
MPLNTTRNDWLSVSVRSSNGVWNQLTCTQDAVHADCTARKRSLADDSIVRVSGTFTDSVYYRSGRVSKLLAELL